MKHLGYIIACFVVLLNVQLVKAQGDVNIGTQVWTSKNLDVSTFRNGEPIQEAKSVEEWEKAGENKQPSWCYYNFDEENGKLNGKLYNWYAVNDSRGLAPKGYHIPSDEEWIKLITFLGGKDKACEKMKSKTGWQTDGKKSGNGSNSSGFNGLPASKLLNYGMFGDIGEEGYWWSSTEFDKDHAKYCSIRNRSVFRDGYYKESGYSVRCLRD